MHLFCYSATLLPGCEASFAIRTPIANMGGKELNVGASHWLAIDGKLKCYKANLLKWYNSFRNNQQHFLGTK